MRFLLLFFLVILNFSSQADVKNETYYPKLNDLIETIGAEKSFIIKAPIEKKVNTFDFNKNKTSSLREDMSKDDIYIFSNNTKLKKVSEDSKYLYFSIDIEDSLTKPINVKTPDFSIYFHGDKKINLIRLVYENNLTDNFSSVIKENVVNHLLSNGYVKYGFFEKNSITDFFSLDSVFKGDSYIKDDIVVTIEMHDTMSTFFIVKIAHKDYFSILEKQEEEVIRLKTEKDILEFNKIL